MKYKKLKISAGAGLAFLILRVLLSAGKDAIVIRTGVRAYHTAASVLAVLCAACFVMAAIAMARSLLRKKAEKEQMEKLEREDRPAAPDPVLSARGMDPGKVQDMLKALYKDSSHACEMEIMQCISLMQGMDLCQEKLAKLLADNGASGLEDAADLLDKVEQYLCREVRKALNYLNVSGPSEEDQAKVREQFLECIRNCSERLGQAREFLFCLAEYFNRQGGDDTTKDTLELYKKCIMDSIGDL